MKAVYGEAIAASGNHTMIKMIAYMFLFFDTVIYWVPCLKVLAQSFKCNIICAPALCMLCRKQRLKGTCSTEDYVCCWFSKSKNFIIIIVCNYFSVFGRRMIFSL